MKRFLVLIFFIVIGGVAAFAATGTAYMYVHATMEATVSVSTTNLDFGAWTPTSPDVASAATIAVTATLGTGYKVTLDKGSNYGLSTNAALRALNFSSLSYVGYGIYKDSAHTTEWGDSDFLNTYPAGSSQAGTGSGSAQMLTAYGLLMPSTATAAAQPGAYQDFVTVTINF